MGEWPLQLGLAGFFLFLLVAYLVAVVSSNQSYKKWPLARIISMISGSAFAIVAVFGPLAELSHTWFPAHMIGHLFLGMLAPLLIVMASPMTLLLRTIPVPIARKVSRVLRSGIGRLTVHPIFTTILNVGGLWVLYTTELFSFMHQQPILYVFVHLHVFIAGYLFTASIIYVDLVSHRLSYLYRSIVLVLALAAHGILSKYLYVNPPVDIPIEEARVGSQIMYYGGDAVDLILIFILCMHWFKATRPRRAVQPSMIQHI